MSNSQSLDAVQAKAKQNSDSYYEIPIYIYIYILLRNTNIYIYIVPYVMSVLFGLKLELLNNPYLC